MAKTTQSATKKSAKKKSATKKSATKKSATKKSAKKKSATKKSATKKSAKKKRAPVRRNSILALRAITRAPVSLDGAELAELGHVLELETPDRVIRWGRSQAVLAWAPRQRALVIFEGANRTTTEPKPKGSAAQAFSRWAARAPRKRTTLDVRVSGAWRSVAPALRIDYRSDKWGKTNEYTHRLGKGVRLYVQGSTRAGAARVWVLKGGRLTVTARGIVH